MKRRVLALAGAALVLAGVVGSIALAQWLIGGAGSGAGRAQQVNAGNAPVASTAGSSVTLTWAPTTLSGGQPVLGYLVKRYTTAGALQTTNAACSGVIATLGCTESGVPAGTWDYTVTPTRAGWAGAQSTKTRITVDTTAPTVVFTFPAAGTRYGPSNWDGGCGTAGVGDVCGTAADAGSGVNNVKVSIKRTATNLYWDGSSFASATEVLFTATGTTSWTYTFPLTNYPSNVDDTYTITAKATDNSLNTGTASRSYTVDRAAPATTDNTGSLVPTAPSTWFAANQTVTLTPVDPATPITTYHTTDGSNPTTSSATGTSISLNANGTYTIKYFSVDSVTNTEAVKTGVNQIKIDKTTPSSANILTPAANATVRATVSMTGSGADALSGVYGIEYLYCAGSGCTPATSIGTSATPAGSYPIAWDTTVLADGTYRVRSRVHDNANNVLNSSIRTVTIDNTAPAVTLTVPANNSATNDTTPSLSGAAGNASGDNTPVTVKIYSGVGTAGTVVQTIPVNRVGAAWSTTAAVLVPGTYTAQATQTDTTGNTGTSTANTFIVDIVAPQVTAVSSVNVGTLGKVDAGDKLVVTFSEALNPATVPGSGTLTFSAPGGSNTFSISGLTNGTISTGTTGWVAAGQTISYTGTFALSSGNAVVTFTVGACTAGCANAGAGAGSGTVPFAPAPAITDPAGNPAIGPFNATLTLF